MSNITYLTQEGYDKLQAEVDELKSDGRANVAKAIAEARAQGDLSENAEYDAAKDAQGMLEMKINKLETALASARIIDQSQLDDSKVGIFSVVTIKNLKNSREVTYTLTSETEANLKEKKISLSSPIGKGLLGKEVGDIAEVETPGGVMKFEIRNITL
jgi:transcription elongation factor GreA